MRIILIAQCRRLIAQVQLGLRPVNAVIDVFDDTSEASHAIGLCDYDVLIADIDHTETAILPILAEAAQARTALRTLVCGAREALPLVKLSIGQGASDFLLKPMDPDELRLRVSWLATYDGEHPGPSGIGVGVIECGPIRVDRSTQSITVGGRTVNLTPRERGVLHVLLRHRNAVVSKDRIASRVFSLDDQADATSIETYVYRLRRKIVHPDVEIRTVRSLGYLLEIRQPD